MASSPITSWQIEGEKVEAMTNFIFIGSKVTADGDFTHEIRRWLLLGRKTMTNRDSMLKSKDIILLTMVYVVKAIIFSVVMDGCESCTLAKAESQRIGALELWCWRRLLRVPCIERRSNHSIVNKISPEYSLEWLMLKLKLQYFGHRMQTADSLEKSLTLGKTDSRRIREWQRMRWLNGITDAMNVNLGKLQEMVRDRKPGMLESMGLVRIGHGLVTEPLCMSIPIS